MKKYSDKELLEIIRLHCDELGYVPPRRTFSAKNGLPSYSNLIYRFGSFSNAIKLAGFEPNISPHPGIKIHTNEELLQQLKCLIKIWRPS